MRVLLSIKPEFVERIFRGEKTFEFRRRIFKNPAVTSAVVYSTSPVCRIVGEFEIAGVIEAKPPAIWARTRRGAGITKDFFESYFAERDVGYALIIGRRRRFKTDIEPRKADPAFVAPQSYRYVKSHELIDWLGAEGAA